MATDPHEIYEVPESERLDTDEGEGSVAGDDVDDLLEQARANPGEFVNVEADLAERDADDAETDGDDA